MLFLLVLLFQNKSLHLDSNTVSNFYSEGWIQGAKVAGDSAFLVFDADNDRSKGLQIYQLGEKTAEKILETSQKEDLYYAQTIFYDTFSKKLFIMNLNKPLLYTFDKEIGLKRFKQMSELHTCLAYKGNVYFFTGLFDSKILTLHGELPTGFSAINKQLVSLFSHDADSKININNLHVQEVDNKIYIASTLSDKIRVFRPDTGQMVETIPIREYFRAYKPLPQKIQFPKRSSSPKETAKFLDDWLAQGHQLCRMDLFQGRLYGYILDKQLEHGTWVALSREAFHWDNKKEKKKIIAMGSKKILVGTQTENKEGDIEWDFWLESALPSH